MTTWTEEQDKALVEQIRAGRTLREISSISNLLFGREYSRNALGGRVWRMRLRDGDPTLRAGISVGRVATRFWTPEQRAAKKSKPHRGGWYYAKRRMLAKELNIEPPDAEMLRALQVLNPSRKRRRRPPGLPERMNEQGIVCCEAVTIHQLFSDMCHWPLWQCSDPFDFDELKYCGNACKGVYCEAHRQIGYFAGRRRRTPEERAWAIRNHYRFTQNGGQNIGRAA